MFKNVIWIRVIFMKHKTWNCAMWQEYNFVSIKNNKPFITWFAWSCRPFASNHLGDSGSMIQSGIKIKPNNPFIISIFSISGSRYTKSAIIIWPIWQNMLLMAATKGLIDTLVLSAMNTRTLVFIARVLAPTKGEKCVCNHSKEQVLCYSAKLTYARILRNICAQ